MQTLLAAGECYFERFSWSVADKSVTSYMFSLLEVCNYKVSLR